MRPPPRAARTLCFLLLAAPAGAGQPAARAARVAEGPRIDGDLSDPSWAAAEPIGPLTQVDPDEGAQPTERTEVRVLFDADFLYIGARMFERDPSRIVATQMARDSFLFVDDRFAVLLDTFLDRRNAYQFEMNPAGARADSLIVENGRDQISEWDGIWIGKARIDAEGWSVEMAIPFRTLAFRPGQTTWGFNVQRNIKRHNEFDRWAGALRNYDFSQVSQAGTLTGLDGIRPGVGVDLAPFTVVKATRNRPAGDSDLLVHPGLDLLVRLTPGLRAAFTVNTDFAETEVDQRRVNLTRFPLFFPEKRQFFLEDAGIFSFGGLERDLVPFFSRRIGLSGDGREIPLLFGVKVTGRSGPWNIGFLDTEMGEGRGVAGKNLLVARVSRNILEQSSVGVLLTRGNPAERGMNAVAGADLLLRTDTFLGDKNLEGRLFFLGSDDTEEGSGIAAGSGLGYSSDLVETGFQFRQIGEDFEPALGFVERTGIRSYVGWLSWQPRPENRLDIRQLFLEVEPEVITSLSNEVETARLSLTPLKARFHSGDEIEINAIPQYERLTEPFEIHEGVEIPEGGYGFTRLKVEAEGAFKRPIVPTAAFEWGGFFDGHRQDLELGLRWKPSRHLEVRADHEDSHIHLREGEFRVRIERLRVLVNFTPDLTWSNLAQWDNRSRSLGFQSRLRFIHRDGQEAFLVLNSAGGLRDLRYDGQEREVSLKLEYTLRF